MKRGIKMSLIKCPECGKEISDRANMCPNCGYTNKNNIKDSKISNVSNQLKTGSIVSLISCSIIIILILGFILMSYTIPDNNSQQSGDVNVTIGLTPSYIAFNDFICFGISLILTIVCFVLIILFLTKKIKNIKLYKYLLLSMAIVQLICAIVSISILACCGIVYTIFPLINLIGAIIVATEKK